MDKSGSQTEGVPHTSNLIETGLSADTDYGSIQIRLDQKKQDKNLCLASGISAGEDMGAHPHLKNGSKIHRRRARS